MGIKTEDNLKRSKSNFGKHVKILLFVILMGVFFRNLGISVVNIGLPSFILDLSGTLTAYGIVIGIFSVTQSMFQFPFAAASDKYGRRLVVLIGLIIYIIGTFLCFIAQNIIQLIVFRAIQGAGAYTSILQAIIGDIYDKEEHGKGMGLYALSMSLGYFGGIVIGGYISSYLGFRNIFSISGILTIISGIVMIIFLKEKGNKKLKSDLESSKNENKMSLNLENIKILLQERQFIITIFLNSVRWFIFGGIMAYLIWVLQVQFILDEIQTSYVLILIVAVYIIFVFISGRLTDRHSPRRMMMVGQVVVILFALSFLTSIVFNLIIFLIITTFVGIGLALYEPAGNTLLLNIIERIDPDLKGTGIGFNNAIGFLCSAIGPIVISSLGEIFIFLPFYLINGLVVITFFITLKLVKK
jgi:MFS family permease